MGKKYRSVWYRCLATLLMAVMLLGNLGFLQEAEAASSYNIGNATVTANFISHATAIKYNTRLSCKNLSVGSGTHYCCWAYAAAAYKAIWGVNFSRSTSNNYLRNIEAADRKLTAANLKKYFADAKPGAMLRIDNDPVPGNWDDKGHSLIYLQRGADGAFFWEGNYNSKGETRIKYYSWSSLAGYNGYKYIKYIQWPGASAYAADYTAIDSTARIGISTKPASGEDQCYVKEKPFEDSKDKSAAVPEGNTIKIVGAVENKYGNTWYKTEDGGFVYSGDIIFYQDYFTISAKFKNTERRSSKKLPFVDSDSVKTIGNGDTVQVTRFVLNSYGNIWAQLTDGSYLCFYDKKTGENKMQFSAHVTQPTHSTTYPQGNIKVTSTTGFALKGDVKAEVPFLSLSVRIVDRETEKDVSVTGSPCTLKPGINVRTINLLNTKIGGKAMDDIVLIRKLYGSSGWYHYELNAQFGFTYDGRTFKFGNEYNFVSSNFSVGKAGATEPPIVVDPFARFDTLFTLSAKFKNTERRSSHKAPYLDSPEVKTIGNGDIVEVAAFVTNTYGNIWAKLADGSYLCFYDSETGENKMQFYSHVTQPTISSATKPTGNINVTNQGFWLKGTVKAEVPFLTLSTRIIDRETGKDVEGRSPITIKPGNVKSVAISKDNDSKDLDSLTKFTNLPKGWYQYQLNAQFGFTYSGKTFQFGGTHNFITSDFTVGNPGTLDVTPTPTPTPIPTPTLSPTPTPSGNEENEEVSLILGDAWFNEEGFIEIEVFFSPLKDMLAYQKFTFERDFDAQFAYPRGEAAGVSWTCNANGLTFDNSLGISSSGYARLFNIVFEQTDKYLSDFTFTIHCVDAEMYDSETNTYTPIAVKSATKSYHLTPPEEPPAGDEEPPAGDEEPPAGDEEPPAGDEGNRLAGDAKEDGVVDMRDALTVLKYLAGWDVQINLSNADVNRDTACDMRDALSILKYLAGWNVVLQ